jgi:hypothetical protein
MEVDRVWTEEGTPESLQVPVLACAIHNGHLVREEVASLLALDDAERLREEDPFTAEWTLVAPLRIVGLVSRFQVDLNRPREKAVYRTPEDAWGLEVWKEALPGGVVDRSLAEYEVLDIHSYNHRRNGPSDPGADEAMNPQVNVGTGTMDRARWGPVIDRFMKALGTYDFPGGRLDVRENVRFRGGQFPRWAHTTYPDSACVIAVEFKKFFMDEWNGGPRPDVIEAIKSALQSTVPGIVDELGRL